MSQHASAGRINPHLHHSTPAAISRPVADVREYVREYAASHSLSRAHYPHTRPYIAPHHTTPCYPALTPSMPPPPPPLQESLRAARAGGAPPTPGGYPAQVRRAARLLAARALRQGRGGGCVDAEGAGRGSNQTDSRGQSRLLEAAACRLRPGRHIGRRGETAEGVLAAAAAASTHQVWVQPSPGCTRALEARACRLYLGLVQPGRPRRCTSPPPHPAPFGGATAPPPFRHRG
jgi:hypothetical protein